jgi:hypothetical protein
MLVFCWLISSLVVQAVLTEDDIIDKELTWAAMARKVHQHCFYGSRGSSKTRNINADVNTDFDWTQDDHDWVQQQQQRQQDRIQLQRQQQEQQQPSPQQRQQLRTTTKRRNSIQ